MSLNRYEQTMFDYWAKAPDERRHWQTKVTAAVASNPTEPGETARNLERDLWAYFTERAEHVRDFRELNTGGLRRVSFLNLAEYLLRLWAPPAKPKNNAPAHTFDQQKLDT